MNKETLPLRLLDHLGTAVVLLDAELRVSYLNTAAEALLRTSSRQSRGRELGCFLVDFERGGEMRRALAAGRGYTHRRTTLRPRGAAAVMVDYTFTPLAVEGSAMAILEFHSQESIMRINREEAHAAAVAGATELLRGLAHEIKNPLAGIHGAAELLAMETGCGADGRGGGARYGSAAGSGADLGHYADIIIKETERLAKLIDRVSGTRQAMAPKPTAIHRVIERVAAMVEAEARRQPLRVVRDYDPSIPPVTADGEQLVQAFLNIARNALLAISAEPGPPPRRPGEIRFRTRVRHQLSIGPQLCRTAVAIDIMDNGPGIPPELLDTMFHPMVSGRPDGTGLGLAISRDIIDRHHGTIQCASKPGATRFSVFLPIQPPAGQTS